MGEDEQEQQHGITLPMEWHVPEHIRNHYVHNVIVQPGVFELTLFFFENQVPPFTGSAEANKEFLLKLGSIRSECVSKMTVAPQLVPQIIKALQEALDNYNKGTKMQEKREENT